MSCSLNFPEGGRVREEVYRGVFWFYCLGPYITGIRYQALASTGALGISIGRTAFVVARSLGLYVGAYSIRIGPFFQYTHTYIYMYIYILVCADFGP